MIRETPWGRKRKPIIATSGKNIKRKASKIMSSVPLSEADAAGLHA